MQLAPVVLFVYNRPWHTQQTLCSLINNHLSSNSDLFIFSEGPKDEQDAIAVGEVRTLIHKLKGFRRISIVERPVHLGLAASIITGVSEILEREERVVVMEDDLVSAPSFLEFVNRGLEAYQDDARIFSVSGYVYPYQPPKGYTASVLLFPRASTWGWATWRNRWQQADWRKDRFDDILAQHEMIKKLNQGGEDLSTMLKLQSQGKINSWGIRWCLTHAQAEAYGLFPAVSLIRNIGLDGSGVHCKSTSDYEVLMADFPSNKELPLDIVPDPEVIGSIRVFFDSPPSTAHKP
jgi:hypothetical protein